MSTKWTDEQRMVLEERGNDLLVSAAAGSGKTAVMVERIISLITEGENPPDIDRFLVVTFTRAAAASMKERIGEALQRALEQDPENAHLQKQVTLMSRSLITTIDSFCAEVVRTHFYELDIEPGFRVADEDEMKLLKEDVMNDLLEEAHGKIDEDENIRAFFERFVSRFDDTAAAEQIRQLYEISCAYPRPDAFRASLAETYAADDESSLSTSHWMIRIRQMIMDLTRDTFAELSNLSAIAPVEISKTGKTKGQIRGYAPTLQEDTARFETLKCFMESEDPYYDYDALCEQVAAACAWGRMGTYSASNPDVDRDLTERIKNSRDAIKKEWDEVRKGLLGQQAQDILEMNRAIRKPLQGLIDLTDCFETRFAQAKTEQGVADFSDLEHFALQILTDPEGNPSATGEAYARQFLYVMTDEYQDSNLVQETILRAVSGNACRAANRFMVGDVKQSIYRFRQARPDLFMEKYRNWKKVRTSAEYRDVAGESHVVELRKNFRSRPVILNSVNRVFSRIMAADVGGVDYDADAMLYPGAIFPDQDMDPEPEILLLEDASASEEEEVFLEEEEPGDLPDPTQEMPDGGETDFLHRWEYARDMERESFLVAERIAGLLGRFPVTDEETGELRPATCSDVAILYRGGAGWPGALEKALYAFGIPSFAGSGGGYFDTLEVRTILNALSLIDNPKQDIPLAGVLRSPIGAFDDHDLARMRAACREGDLFTALKALSETGHEKAVRFLAFLDRMRSLVPFCSVHELIWQLLDETGYETYVCALPGGERRRANIRLLIQKAMDYEQGSYRGLFNFLRYIENIKKVSDPPEAVLSDAGDRAVRIMTMHKSKGLEFPIVILCGLGKTLSSNDLKEQVLTDFRYGAGLDHVDTDRHVRVPSVQKKMILRLQKEEGRGEELRVLYVAMTRAKEKLIMTGTVKNRADAERKQWLVSAASDGLLPARCRRSFTTFLNILMPAVMQGDTGILVTSTESETLGQRIAASLKSQKTAVTKTNEPQRVSPEREALRARLRQMMERDATALELQKAPVIPYTVSVSELKHPMYEEEVRREALSLYLSTSGDDEEAKPEPDDQTLTDSMANRADLTEPTNGSAMPHPAYDSDVSPGALRGTAYHTLMEHLDYEDPDIKGQLESLVKYGKIDQFAADRIRLADVEAFIDSDIGRRMKRAFQSGTLHRETPFVIGRKARELKEEWDSDETVLVQGIIDAWFEEDERIVLLDYKTDLVSADRDPTGASLIRKYQLQLQIYRDALASLTGRAVEEVLIWSFSLGRSILVPLQDADEIQAE